MHVYTYYLQQKSQLNLLYANDSTGQLCLKVVRHPEGLNFHSISCRRILVPKN